MGKKALEDIALLETKELGHCGDVIGIMDIEGQMMQDKNLKSVKKTVPEEKVIRKSSPGFKFSDEAEDNANRTAAKLLQEMPDDDEEDEDKGVQHKVASKKCRDCDGFITWDGWTQGSFALHVDKNGYLIGDGDCPEYEKT